MSNKSFLGLFLAALVLLPGCIHVPTYQRKSLKSVSDHYTYGSAEKNVIVWAKLLSREDKSALFGSRSRLIHDNDLQVIHLSIHNLSSVHYLSSPTDINLSMMSYREVAKLMKTSSIGRLTGSTVSGVYSGALGAAAVFTIGDLGVSSFACAAAFLAPSVVCASMALVFFGTSIKSIVMNRRMSKDLKEKTLHEKVMINSGDCYEGLIFVKAVDYTPQFTVVMHEKDNEKNTVMFDVDLRKSDLPI